MKILRVILLFPFSLVYALITMVRNLLYDFNILKSHTFELPVINVGNLSTGGTGKTPHAEYLITLLSESNYQVGYLSRGYKRKSKGYVLADKESNAEILGDEAFQIYDKFKIPLAVCENRVLGVSNLLKDAEQLDIIILDDAFQHRRIRAGFNIMITPFSHLFYKDLVLPSGNLRETRAGKKRADMVVVSKSPFHIDHTKMQEIHQKLKIKPETDVFFSYLQYNNLYSIDKQNEIDTESLKGYYIIFFTGIGNTNSIETFLGQNSVDYRLIKYPDHHTFSTGELQNIIDRFNQPDQKKKLLLTTEKDYYRLSDPENKNLFKSLPLYVLPISVRFLNYGKNSLDDKVLAYVRENKGKR